MRARKLVSKTSKEVLLNFVNKKKSLGCKAIARVELITRMHPSQQESQMSSQCEHDLQFYLVIPKQPPKEKYLSSLNINITTYTNQVKTCLSTCIPEMMHHEASEQLQDQKFPHQSQWQMVKHQPSVQHLRSKELEDKTKNSVREVAKVTEKTMRNL